jgi:hypothetical protein
MNKNNGQIYHSADKLIMEIIIASPVICQCGILVM